MCYPFDTGMQRAIVSVTFKGSSKVMDGQQIYCVGFARPEEWQIPK